VLLVAERLGKHHLDRDVPIDEGVERLLDGAGRALAELADNLVFADFFQHLARWTRPRIPDRGRYANKYNTIKHDVCAASGVRDTASRHFWPGYTHIRTPVRASWAQDVAVTPGQGSKVVDVVANL
jgi:hypothetical protein